MVDNQHETLYIQADLFDKAIKIEERVKERKKQ